MCIVLKFSYKFFVPTTTTPSSQPNRREHSPLSHRPSIPAQQNGTFPIVPAQQKGTFPIVPPSQHPSPTEGNIPHRPSVPAQQMDTDRETDRLTDSDTLTDRQTARQTETLWQTLTLWQTDRQIRQSDLRLTESDSRFKQLQIKRETSVKYANAWIVQQNAKVSNVKVQNSYGNLKNSFL